MVSGLVSLYSRPVQNTSGLDGGIIVVAANVGYGMMAHVTLAQYWDGRSAAALRRMFHDARYVLKDAADDGGAWHRGGEAGAADSGEG